MVQIVQHCTGLQLLGTNPMISSNIEWCQTALRLTPDVILMPGVDVQRMVSCGW